MKLHIRAAFFVLSNYLQRTDRKISTEQCLVLIMFMRYVCYFTEKKNIDIESGISVQNNWMLILKRMRMQIRYLDYGVAFNLPMRIYLFYTPKIKRKTKQNCSAICLYKPNGMQFNFTLISIKLEQ